MAEDSAESFASRDHFAEREGIMAIDTSHSDWLCYHTSYVTSALFRERVRP